MSLRWEVEGEDHVLVSSVPLLGRRGPRVGPAGIRGGLLGRKVWPWPDVAAVSWDVVKGGATLGICLFGDPWVKDIGLWAWSWARSWDDCRALLEEIRPVVERAGARCENRDEAAVHWWHLDPDARRR